MNNTLYIIVGKPGSGKSTYVKNKLSNVPYHYEADMYFMKDGKYKFDPKKLTQAHTWCKLQVHEKLMKGYDCAVSNTFISPDEIWPYLKTVNDINFQFDANIEVEIVECTYENASNSEESSCFNSIHFRELPFEEQCKIADNFDKKDKRHSLGRKMLYNNYSDIIRKVVTHKLIYDEVTDSYTEKYVQISQQTRLLGQCYFPPFNSPRPFEKPSSQHSSQRTHTLAVFF